MPRDHTARYTCTRLLTKYELLSAHGSCAHVDDVNEGERGKSVDSKRFAITWNIFS